MKPDDVLLPVGERALMLRINRKLQNKRLRKVRSETARAASGTFYVCDDRRVLETHVDIEEYARRLGVMEPYEAYTAPE